MINASEAFYNVITSNVRPEMHISIEVYKAGLNTDTLQYYIETVKTFTEHDITSLTFKNGIDPLSRELPELSLEWKQVVTEKTKDTTKYAGCGVRLKFGQDLGYTNTWYNIKQAKKTWGDLKKQTWYDVRKSSIAEELTMPVMCMLAEPTIQNDEITWKAGGMLQYIQSVKIALGTKINGMFGETTSSGLVSRIIEEGYYNTNASIFAYKSFNEIRDYFLDLEGDFAKTLPNKSIVIDDTVADSLNGVLSMYCMYIKNARPSNDYDYYCKLNLGIIFSSFQEAKHDNAIIAIDDNCMYDYPEVTEISNIHNYEYKTYLNTVDYDSPSTVDSNTSYAADDETRIMHFGYNIGSPYDKYGDFKTTPALQAANDIGEVREFSAHFKNPNDVSVKLTVYPINSTSVSNVLNVTDYGENYTEDNKFCVFGPNDTEISTKKENLKKYLNSNSYSLQFEFNGNPMLEPGDIIKVPTGETYKNGENILPIIKKCVIISTEFTYNGSLKEKIIAHGLSEEQ